MNKIFNFKIHKLRRERAFNNWEKFSYLKNISVERVYERLFEVNRSFELGLDLGCHNGELGFLLNKKDKINNLIQTDFLLNYCNMARLNDFNSVVIDVENLPFKENKYNVILSSFFFHWIEDAPKLFYNLRKIMKPDSLLLINFFGGGTLADLQKLFIDIEIKLLGGSSPRIIPFLDIKSVGSLIQNSGFNMPVIDSEKINVSHSNLLDLFYDLRGMGQTNCMQSTSKTINRKVLNLLKKKIKSNKNINTSFELLTITAWTDKLS
jgi:SAM-dependent methyltransferase